MKRFGLLACLLLPTAGYGQPSVLVWEELADRHADKVSAYARSNVRSGENVVVDKPYLSDSCSGDFAVGAGLLESRLDNATSGAVRGVSAIISRGDFSVRLQELYEREFDRLGRESMDPAVSPLLSKIRSAYLGKGTIDWLFLTRLSCDSGMATATTQVYQQFSLQRSIYSHRPLRDDSSRFRLNLLGVFQQFNRDGALDLGGPAGIVETSPQLRGYGGDAEWLAPSFHLLGSYLSLQSREGDFGSLQYEVSDPQVRGLGRIQLGTRPRIGVLIGGEWRGFKSEYRDEIGLLAAVEITDYWVDGGLWFGSMLNGGGVVGGYLVSSSARDVTPGNQFFGQPDEVWSSTGWRASLIWRRTGRRTDFELSGGVRALTQTYEESYWGFSGDADHRVLSAGARVGIRVAPTLRIGASGWYARRRFLESAGIPERFAYEEESYGAACFFGFDFTSGR
jgi:hypothetical protein